MPDIKPRGGFFCLVKKVVSGPLVLAPFDLVLTSILQTDASRLYGVGYTCRIMVVDIYASFNSALIAETRYVTVEQEIVTVVWDMAK